MRIPVVVLAAGGSRRLGQPKQLLLTHGETLLGRTLRIAKEAEAEPIFVVLGANATLVASALDLSDFQTVLNPDWDLGISTSINAGLRALMETEPHALAVMMLVCDQPELSTQHLRQLTAAYESSGGGAIVASNYGKIRGIPVIFPSSLFASLKSLEGDNGARQLLRTTNMPVMTVPFVNGEIDIDTPDDLSRLLDNESVPGKREVK